MNEKEIEAGLLEAVKLGWVKRVGKDKFKLTKKGQKHVESLIPKTVKRSSLGKMGAREFFLSADEEMASKK